MSHILSPLKNSFFQKYETHSRIKRFRAIKSKENNSLYQNRRFSDDRPLLILQKFDMRLKYEEVRSYHFGFFLHYSLIFDRPWSLNPMIHSHEDSSTLLAGTITTISHGFRFREEISIFEDQR